MAYVFQSDALYSNGQSVQQVLQLLQERYHFLDRFDYYVAMNIDEILNAVDLDNNIDDTLLEDILTYLFQEYILLEETGVVTKGGRGISFVDSSLLVTTTRVKFIQ